MTSISQNLDLAVSQAQMEKLTQNIVDDNVSVCSTMMESVSSENVSVLKKAKKQKFKGTEIARTELVEICEIHKCQERVHKHFEPKRLMNEAYEKLRHHFDQYKLHQGMLNNFGAEMHHKMYKEQKNVFYKNRAILIKRYNQNMTA